MNQTSKPQGVTGFPRATSPAKKRRSSPAVSLPAELGVEQAVELRKTLLKHIGSAKPVTLDASDIRQIHTAALQVFCLFCRDRRASGHDTRFSQPSAVLRSAAALLGATTLLSLGQEPV
ncbi:MAG: STAS domain-containing protein [Stenotrophobium sp.]